MPDSGPEGAIGFSYTFRVPDGPERQFEVRLNADTLELLPPPNAPKPAWTKLKFFQCENCPLGDEIEYCPVAVNLAGLVEIFRDAISHEKAFVRVQTAERAYEKDTTMQKGLSSIIGIYMVTSNCPVLDKLRPNVRFHLPFASMDESVYRAVAMYLMAQYFRMRAGREPDWDLKNLRDLYKEIACVNRGMSERLRHATAEDANVNAVIILSTHGDMVPMSADDRLADIAKWFRGYTHGGTSEG